MTYEKWMEEMSKKMAMEMLFSRTDDPAMFPAEHKLNDFIDDDEEDECKRE